MVKGRLQKTAEGLEYTRKILVNGVWIAIFIVVLSAIGWYLLQSGQSAKEERGVDQVETIKPAPPSVNWEKVDASVAMVLQEARGKARDHADRELKKWFDSLLTRVDDSFLDWYFSYWTQQMLGLQGLYQYGVHHVLKEQPTASEKLTEEIQEEFSTRVLQPQIAQRVLERIVNETATIYIDVLTKGLDDIPATYSISEAEWENYLQDIAITAESTDGSRQTPLSLKALTVSGTGGVVVLATNLKTVMAKSGSKVLGKSAGKAVSSMATKTGGKVVAKAGSKFLGVIVGFGVLVWDVWDHNTTERENRPFLRLAIADYFRELQSLLLDDPEYGIMSTFLKLEKQVAENRLPQ